MKTKYLKYFAAVSLLSQSLAASEGKVLVGTEVINRLKVNDEITVDTTDSLGETIDLYTGSLSFYHTDISIPGNSGLPVSLGRKFHGADFYDRNSRDFGDWGLNIPSISTTLPQSRGWKSNRCSGGLNPGPIMSNGSVYEAHEYWNGVQLNLPDGSSQKIVEHSSNSFPNVPSGTELITKQLWTIQCIGSTSEGFVARSPSGVKYTFNKLVSAPAPGVYKDFKMMPRNVYFMLVTQIEDLWGNKVTYKYDGNKLVSITSNDGRSISINYNASGLISSATANGKTWRYSYTQDSYGKSYLDKITLPDSRYWKLDLMDIATVKPIPNYWTDGNGDSGYTYPAKEGNRNSAEGSITSPNGLKGTFYLSERSHGRINVPRRVMTSGMSINYEERMFDTMSLVKKVLTGPGLKNMTWSYYYSETDGAFSGDSAPSVYKYVITTAPDGTDTVTYFHRSYDWREGLKYKVRVRDENNVDLQSTYFSYTRGTLIGAVDELNSNIQDDQYLQLVTQERVVHQGNDYYTKYSDFDIFDRPKQVESYLQGASQKLIKKTTYIDHVADWVIGLEDTVSHIDYTSTDNDRVSTEKYVYCTSNTTTCRKYLPSSMYKNGVKVVDWTYHSDGNYKTIKDANSKVYTFSNYKRGLPQTIYSPGITTPMSASVNNDGTIASVTDFEGNKNQYSYDVVGRLSKIVLPLENGTNYWQSSNIDYQKVDGDDIAISGAGLESGQWKQVVTQGDYQKTRYLDALMRTVLLKEVDLMDSSLTRYIRTEFDAYNRVTFQSVAASYAGETKGTHTEYDALGRVVSVTTPVGKTTMSYLSGNRKEVINPRYHTTTYTYQAFGAPSYERVTKIESPENVDTVIELDAFGKTKSITQGNGSVSATRTYEYDNRHQLCRTYNPETGYTSTYYDNAGLLKWEKIGDSSNRCNQGATAPSEATIFAYSARGDIKTVNYPSGTSDLSFSYDRNGNLTSADRGSVKWYYTYNSLNELSSERLAIDSRSFPISYSYDGRGNLSAITYPSGRLIDLLPNAFGQQTKAGNYARNVKYHPSGQLKQFTYGNGKVFNQTLNAQMLPDVVGVDSRAKVNYDYDANANVTRITDYISSSENRTMSYDGLDRLKTANGPWGTGSFNYDALGNITYKKLGSRNYTYSYNRSTNKLSSVTGSRSYSFGYDAHGNVKSNGRHTFAYDKANLMLTVNSGSVARYGYDAHKRRAKVIDDTGTHYPVYNKAGQFLHKFSVSGSKPADYVYLAGKQIAKVEGAPGPQAPATPGYITVPESDNDGSYSVYWRSEEGVSSYILQEKKNSGNWTTVYSGSATSKTLTNRSTGTYQYRVRSCSGGYCSLYRESSVVDVNAPVEPSVPATPTGLSAPSSDSDGFYEVTWNAVSGATRYELDRKVGAGSWLTVSNNSNTSYWNDLSLTSLQTFRVRACNSAGCSSYSGNVQTNVDTGGKPGGGGWDPSKEF
ncbi:RHS repeat domain-containing protein [Aliikangiella sp. G2MR2-5]|uniref:RHS repeat domain-containing protein n=1 Tax=Aliikangiella sp. G2MR2-5 TaxID=2788943 RepID=UPI0018AB2421|nr:hypothetical protein [Aliikangiella sp. G2MR2-5]